MSSKELQYKIAYLESINDHLQTEMDTIDQLMRLVGFSGGIATVKATAEEILRLNEEEFRESA